MQGPAAAGSSSSLPPAAQQTGQAAACQLKKPQTPEAAHRNKLQPQKRGRLLLADRHSATAAAALHCCSAPGPTAQQLPRCSLWQNFKMVVRRTHADAAACFAM